MFSPAVAGTRAFPVRVITRKGHALLIVPANDRLCAQRALTLYSPQTPLAKTARAIWHWTLSFGIALGSYKDSLCVDSQKGLMRFLRELQPAPNHDTPLFALLAGNPNGHAPRHIILLFDSDRNPVTVVKCGISEPAGQLVQNEAAFLLQLRSFLVHQKSRSYDTPVPLGIFNENDINAFAVPYAQGNSPDLESFHKVTGIMTDWLIPNRKSRISDLQAWRRLTTAAASDHIFDSIKDTLQVLMVSPALFHGDFAPWNIKASPRDGTWVILDWERGELEGPPAWDWFHFELQWAALARKRKGPELLHIAQELLAKPAFKSYAARAGLSGHEAAWLKAYLLYCKHVLRPKEGSPELDSLLNHLPCYA